MFTRTLSAAAAGALILGLAVVPAKAQDPLHTEFLTFNAPIALPGIVLSAGTYSFELPTMTASQTIVRVKSRDGKQVFFTQFTREVVRPWDGKVPRVKFREAAAGTAQPIDVWYPSGLSEGRQFIYVN